MVIYGSESYTWRAGAPREVQGQSPKSGGQEAKHIFFYFNCTIWV